MFDPEAVSEIINHTLQNNSILGTLLTPENTATLLNYSLIRPVSAGDVLCQQGKVDKTLYFLVQGEVDVITTIDGELKTITTLEAGELIGEISALFSIPRIANIVVTQPSIVLEISANVFWSILHENPFAKDEIIKRSRKRITETSLRCVPIFTDLDSESMRELSSLATLIQAEKNAIIANEGAVERCMYVICSGTARVYINLKGVQYTIALLQPGDYFGEYSLFSGGARSASVSAITDLRLVELKGESFQSFVEYFGDIGQEINDSCQRRLDELGELRDGLNTRKIAETRLQQVQQMLGEKSQ